jgi:hypothetical protein
MTIKQHIPNFVDGAEPYTDAFLSCAGLLELHWVAQWAKDPGFHRYSLNENRLMCERNEGREWWVIGIIKATPGELRALALPVWKPIYEAAPA